MTDNDSTAIIAKGTRWLHAEDGRIVEYSVTGSTRSDARTVVAGYFAVTEEPASWTAAYGSLNVRMINVSLPGLGLSSLHPGRKVADWPRTDLEPMLDAEGVEDFHVYGVSYGTIHAMAVAQHHGPDRVRTMGLRVPYFGLPLSVLPTALRSALRPDPTRRALRPKGPWPPRPPRQTTRWPGCRARRVASP